MNKTRYLPLLAVALLGLLSLSAISSTQANKPAAEAALELLKSGNQRFAAGAARHPNSDLARIHLAGRSNQADYAYATVLSCSDSRVPVEALFDAGVMDLFVIRVAGNVVDTDEAGSIEYGLAHVKTPLLVILGHTQCGAVTAVTHAVRGAGQSLERNIPPLVDNIEPAVRRVVSARPELKDEALIPAAIEENVWQGMRDLFMVSPAVRDLVAAGKVQAVGALYDIGTGRVTWLPQTRTAEILAEVNVSPHKAVAPLATGPPAK